MDEQRSRETRARAELALVRLLHALGEKDVFLVVLGGLVPEILARDEPLVPAHLGTADVDVLLVTHVDPDADLGSVEQALGRLDFEGPEQAARRLLEGELAVELNSLRTTFLEVRERYVGVTDSGPGCYAEQAREVEPELGEAGLRADAVDVVQRFFAELDI